MTHAEFHAWLLGLGMGWLGWTEQQTLESRMTSIMAAYKARIDMLKAIFGGGDGARPAKDATGGVSLKDPAGLRGLLKALGKKG
ncbi:MAG: hypothetical protein J0H01_22160 [Rhizobiales bacterium]|nr:hypothetical protein [Hyphomicrobiales bacterium]